ncbi:MAG: hypothetical protein JO307_31835 [Bryobacterales bacterium]|nr:hypothetical protein [Bryobacterales bacterium]MBV9396384.1 hypothetical protein [Bryobacterales bacterium]
MTRFSAQHPARDWGGADLSFRQPRWVASRAGVGQSSRVFFSCWLIYTFFWTPYIVREHFPAIALMERGSLNVEGYADWSEDIFRGPQGGAYINNNPGASLLAAIPLLLLRPVFTAIDHWNQRRPKADLRTEEEPILTRAVGAKREIYFLAIAFATVAMVMAPATAATAAYLCSCFAKIGVGPLAAAAAALVYGLGTPVFFRAAHLNHNLLVCDAGFIALLWVWQSRLGFAQLVCAGLLSGFALLCDYSGIVVIGTVGAYVLLKSKRRAYAALAFTAGLAPMIAALLIYQQWAFGSFYHPSQHFMTPTAPTARGYRGIDWPSPALLWANFFDARFGLFAYCPLLALAFAAPFVKRLKFRVPRLETSVLFGYFFLFVLFCAANQYSWFQPLTGFRYLVPVVPALAILALQTCQIFQPWLRWVLAIATLGQSFIMSAGHQNSLAGNLRWFWTHGLELPWMYRFWEIGAGVTWLWPAVAFSFLLAAIGLIWLPALRGL